MSDTEFPIGSVVRLWDVHDNIVDEATIGPDGYLLPPLYVGEAGMYCTITMPVSGCRCTVPGLGVTCAHTDTDPPKQSQPSTPP